MRALFFVGSSDVGRTSCAGLILTGPIFFVPGSILSRLISFASDCVFRGSPGVCDRFASKASISRKRLGVNSWGYGMKNLGCLG